MNLYLIFALALGAVSAAPPAPRPVAPKVMEQVAEQRVVLVEHRLQPVYLARLKPGLHRRPVATRRAALTGAATPRAPAVSC
jgi:hypothetical protein